MSRSNTCYYGGRVVGGREALPEAAFEHDTGGPSVGCTHLRCPSCGVHVRTQAGLSTTELSASELLDASDWESLAATGQIERDPEERLYACQCRIHVEDQSRRLTEESDWDYDIPAPPWRCGGHPALSLPTELDGVRLDHETDLARLLDTLADGAPAAAPRWATRPAAWMIRMVSLLRTDPAANQFLAALALGLTDGRPQVKAMLAELYRDRPTLPGGERIAVVLRDEAEAWIGQPHPSGRGYLHTLLEVALARRAVWTDPLGSPMDPDAIEVLWELAYTPHELAQSVLMALGELEPDRLIQEAGEILAVAPSARRARDLLYVLNRHRGDGIDGVAERMAGRAGPLADEVRRMAQTMLG